MAVSRTFQILYRNEDISVNDVILYRFHTLVDSNKVRDKSNVKFLNFRMPENLAVIYLNFKQRGQTFGYFIKKNANGIANSEYSDQSTPLGAV